MSDRKTILVTGCSSGGIGAAVALVLAKKGHHVFATARNLDKIPSELAESVHVTIIKLDVTSPESIASAVEKVGHVTRENDSYGLDAIVNNAGVGYTTPLLDADIEQARMVYETNVFGSLRVVQAFAGLLIARKGRLVNICSVAAMLHAPWMGIYASSKAALTVLSDTLRLELKPFGVSVVTVVLGVVASAFCQNKLPVQLPVESLYGKISNTITLWRDGKLGPQGCTIHDAAREMLPDIIGTHRGLVWRGSMSTFVRLLTNWTPEIIQDWIVSKDQGLDEL